MAPTASPTTNCSFIGDCRCYEDCLGNLGVQEYLGASYTAVFPFLLFPCTVLLVMSCRQLYQRRKEEFSISKYIVVSNLLALLLFNLALWTGLFYRILDYSTTEISFLRSLIGFRLPQTIWTGTCLSLVIFWHKLSRKNRTRRKQAWSGTRKCIVAAITFLLTAELVIPLLPDFGSLEGQYVANILLGVFVIILVLMGFHYGRSVVRVMKERNVKNNKAMERILRRFYRTTISLTSVGVGVLITILWQLFFHKTAIARVAFWWIIGVWMLFVAGILVYCVQKDVERRDPGCVELPRTALPPGRVDMNAAQGASQRVRARLKALFGSFGSKRGSLSGENSSSSKHKSSKNDVMTALSPAAIPKLAAPPKRQRVEIVSVSLEPSQAEEEWKQNRARVVTSEEIESRAEKEDSAEEVSFYYYKDLDGNVQGPFENQRMRSWYLSKQLPKTLKVRQSTEESFRTIKELFPDGTMAFA